jgi:hypothetical protein
MTPESPSRSFWNAYHDDFGIAITMPRNPNSREPALHLKENHHATNQHSSLPFRFLLRHSRAGPGPSTASEA